jgi:hypothetical protein
MSYILIFCVGLIIVLSAYLYKMVGNERKAKLFRINLRKGDRVVFYVFPNKSPEGVVVDSDPLGDGKFVKVETIVPKHLIYP